MNSRGATASSRELGHIVVINANSLNLVVEIACVVLPFSWGKGAGERRSGKRGGREKREKGGEGEGGDEDEGR